MKIAKHQFNIIRLLLVGSVLWSCDDYLAVKPDAALAVPNSVKDYQALIDYQVRMNELYPAAGDVAADYYFLNDADWETIRDESRATYIWDPTAENEQDWRLAYETVFYANVILDGIDDAALEGLHETDRQHVKGSGFFIRGWTFYHLAQLFAPTYIPGDEQNEYGIPLRVTSDINESTQRATVGETYRQIEADLKSAARLLPHRAVLATRPSKLAAYAALSRMYLIMQRYEESLAYADSCLSIQSTLLDFNQLDTLADNAFGTLNQEVLFTALLTTYPLAHEPARARVDTALIRSYQPSDLRLPVFFTTRPDSSWQFKGSYEGSNYGVFAGLATDEVYLNKAEALIRLGQWQEGLAVLDKLLVTRHQTGRYEPADVDNGEAALDLVLQERRKELVFRGGVRWSDLRRLNLEERFETTLTRMIGGEVYTLPPGDPRYTFLIPSNIINLSGINQNPR